MWTFKRIYVACDEDGEVYELLYTDSSGSSRGMGHITYSKKVAELVVQTLNKSMVKI